MGTAAAIRVPIGQRPVIGNNTPRLISENVEHNKRQFFE